MERLVSAVRSITGIFMLVSLLGCFVLGISGDWERFFYYVDVGLISMVIYLFGPAILSKLEQPNKGNQVFDFFATAVWLFTIIMPFVLIAMKQGRLVMGGILVGMIVLIVVVRRSQKQEKQEFKKIEKWFYFAVLLFPFVYALILWFDLQLTASFLILAAVNIALYTEKFIKHVIEAYQAKKKWIPLKFELSGLEPIVLSDKIIAAQDLEQGLPQIRFSRLQFPVEYEVNGIYYKKEKFTYNWFAPAEDRLKVFDYKRDFKGQSLNLIYNPEDPSQISVATNKKEEEEEEIIFDYNKRQKKQNTYALTIAFLGVLLFIINTAVT